MDLKKALLTVTVALVLIGGMAPIGLSESHDDDQDTIDDAAVGPPAPPRPGILVDRGFTRFTFQPDACAVIGFEAHNERFFETIRVPAPCTLQEPEFPRSPHVLQGANATLTLYDTNQAWIRFEAVGTGSVRFQFAPGVSSQGDGNDRTLVSERLTARVFPGSLQNVLGWSSEGLVVTHARGNFILKDPPTTSLVRTAVEEAVGDRRVGGEVDFYVENGVLITEVFAYEPVDLRATNPSHDVYRVIVDGSLAHGSTFVANFPAGFFKDRLVDVGIFGVDEDGVAQSEPFVPADDLADVLEPRPDQPPKYWVVDDAQGTHVLVSIPTWGLRMFEVAGIPAELVPVIVAGVLGGIVFVSAAAVGMFARRPR